ncbi:MAG: hypothetical protein SAMD01599839_24160 [Rectinema sp.]
MNVWDIYNALLDHPSNLARGLLPLDGDWAIVGDVGWMFSNSEIPHSRPMISGGCGTMERTWQDSIKAYWNRDSIEMHTFFRSAFVIIWIPSFKERT